MTEELEKELHAIGTSIAALEVALAAVLRPLYSAAAEAATELDCTPSPFDELTTSFDAIIGALGGSQDTISKVKARAAYLTKIWTGVDPRDT